MRLIAALLGELKVLRVCDEGLLRDSWLALDSGTLADDPRPVPIVGGVATLDLAHPLVALVLERHEDDPLALDFLVSARYSVLLAADASPEPFDEARFHHTLVESALSAATSPMATG